MTPVNPAAIQFRDSFYELVPPTFRTGNGEKYFYTLETCRDLLCEKAYQAFTIRLPGIGDPSNLSFLSYDRNLLRGPAESEDAFAARLSGALEAWGEAGSTDAVLEQLQAYLQGLQSGVGAGLPWLTIVGVAAGETHDTATWEQVYQGDAVGATPTRTLVYPTNFQWDVPSDPSTKQTWRRWLILPMSLVPVAGLAGSVGSTSTAAPSACFTNPGQNVGGVWVPATSGTPVNSPWLTLTGLTGLAAAQVGQWITISGSAHDGNNGCFPIVQVLSATSCVVANPNGVGADGPLTWTVGAYPFIGPGPAWGAPGVVFGQGEQTPPGPPPADTGENIGGVWQPSRSVVTATSPTISWGLNCRADLFTTIRKILRTWKSAGTYYQNVVVAFDCGTGAPGNAYSPNSTQGAGNPDGSWGSVGKNVGGVWVPARVIPGNPSTPYLWDCYAQGTGSYANCSVENVT